MNLFPGKKLEVCSGLPLGNHKGFTWQVSQESCPPHTRLDAQVMHYSLWREFQLRTQVPLVSHVLPVSPFLAQASPFPHPSSEAPFLRVFCENLYQRSLVTSSNGGRWGKLENDFSTLSQYFSTLKISLSLSLSYPQVHKTKNSCLLFGPLWAMRTPLYVDTFDPILVLFCEEKWNTGEAGEFSCLYSHSKWLKALLLLFVLFNYSRHLVTQLSSAEVSF